PELIWSAAARRRFLPLKSTTTEAFTKRRQASALQEKTRVSPACKHHEVLFQLPSWSTPQARGPRKSPKWPAQRYRMVIDMSTGFHFRREGKGILLAWNDPKETPGFKTDFDETFVEKILTHAASRVPVLAEAGVNPRRAWAGLYEMTPDHHCIIGPAPNVEGLYFVNGFSGHGVMHSPASGKVMADLVL